MAINLNCTTFLDRANALLETQRKARSLLKDTEHFRLDDTRRVYLDNVDHILFGNICLLKFLHWGATDMASASLIAHIFDVPNPNHLNRVGTVISKTSCLGMLTIILFQTEHMFSNVVLTLTGKKLRGYETICSSLLKRLSINDDRLSTLILPGLIRNSLHNNGVHENRDYQHTLDGYQFSFRRGEIVKGADWEYVALALFHLLCVVENVIDADEVRTVPFIEDAYVKSQISQ